MHKLKLFLTSLGMGAGYMYFYDAQQGSRRRALLRDQVTSLRNETNNMVDDGLVDMRLRARNVLAELMARLDEENNNDWVVGERVRSELGRYVRHPKAVQSQVENGVVKLSGPILADEVDLLVYRLGAVRGVREIDNQLEVHTEPGKIPSLQGEGRRPGLIRNDRQAMNPSMRLLSGMGGALLALYGGLRRGFLGNVMTASGLALVARGVTNLDMRSLVGMNPAENAVRVQKAINIQAPVEDIYKFWSNLENLPRFMNHVKEVTDLGEGRTHWRVSGPMGREVEWDAVTTRQDENSAIAWDSVPGSPIKSSGLVRFVPNQDGSTHLSINMSYTPPAGALGHAVASLFGTNPRQQMNDDLVRMKSLFETGKTRLDGQTMTFDQADMN